MEVITPLPHRWFTIYTYDMCMYSYIQYISIHIYLYLYMYICIYICIHKNVHIHKNLHLYVTLSTVEASDCQKHYGGNQCIQLSHRRERKSCCRFHQNYHYRKMYYHSYCYLQNSYSF
jgi:hypothetical protein